MLSRFLASLAVLVGWFVVARTDGAEPRSWPLELSLHGRPLEGSPLSWNSKEVRLLARDGRLWTFAPADAADFKKSAEGFAPWTQAQTRAALLKELGPEFEVNGTGHYLVAHPTGISDAWGERFEELYRSFTRYFAVRGFTTVEPEFPLVAIVYRNQDDFLAAAAADGVRAPGVLGYYSPSTNRVSLFDVGGGKKKDDESWRTNADTIVHEATHQTAFNTGVHRRFASAPRWVVEGLGTMFEAPGVWDAQRHPLPRDRVNRGRREDFDCLAASRPKAYLAEYVSSDQPFAIDMGAAYAEAWALSYFLSESRPRQYSDYLARLAQRPLFQEYNPVERLRDFSEIFGEDLSLLDAHFTRFIAELP